MNIYWLIETRVQQGITVAHSHYYGCWWAGDMIKESGHFQGSGQLTRWCRDRLAAADRRWVLVLLLLPPRLKSDKITTTSIQSSRNGPISNVCIWNQVTKHINLSFATSYENIYSFSNKTAAENSSRITYEKRDSQIALKPAIQSLSILCLQDIYSVLPGAIRLRSCLPVNGRLKIDQVTRYNLVWSESSDINNFNIT